MKRKDWKFIGLSVLILFFHSIVGIYFLVNNNSVVKGPLGVNERLNYSGVQSSAWILTEVISTDPLGCSSCSSRSPEIAVERTGHIHVVWNEGTNLFTPQQECNIIYRRWNATTGAWMAIEEVSTEGKDSTNHPTIAVDGEGNVHVAWYEKTNYSGAGTDYDIFYKCRNATLGTWTTTEVVSTESTAHSRHPKIAVDGKGHVHVIWWDRTNYSGAGTDADIFYKCWNASTGTWTQTEVI
ncbi:MAG: hypothetical protein HWN66_04115, partial [Candidatus Helarchaeota archaeon]|nr:hypothetical protein [Candidatus Helarchaeota archaeon]